MNRISRLRNSCCVYPLFVALFIALSLAACAPTSTDLLQPRATAGLDSAGNRPGIQQIASAIRQGAIRKGWSILREDPGTIYASVSSGGHDASVRIKYDAQGWEILRESTSSGLKYNPDYRGRVIIHYRYNSWVRGLDAAIQDALLKRARD